MSYFPPLELTAECMDSSFVSISSGLEQGTESHLQGLYNVTVCPPLSGKREIPEMTLKVSHFYYHYSFFTVRDGTVGFRILAYSALST